MDFPPPNARTHPKGQATADGTTHQAAAIRRGPNRESVNKNAPSRTGLGSAQIGQIFP